MPRKIRVIRPIRHNGGSFIRHFVNKPAKRCSADKIAKRERRASEETEGKGRETGDRKSNDKEHSSPDNEEN